jgi:tRNA-guanine family transglycosylase
MIAGPSIKSLTVAGGILRFPTFLPVTTFGGRYPLDTIARPYLQEIFPAIMVSHFYALPMKERLPQPTFVDSGGFASLFDGSTIVDLGDRSGIQTEGGTITDPAQVLELQRERADIGATLDFIVSPDMDEAEATIRQDLTIRNALWALQRWEGDDSFHLFASLQAWDSLSATRIVDQLAEHPFTGFALGGMVPRVRNPQVIFEIVAAIRRIDSERPLHVFGVGNPSLVKALFDQGVDSTDSSSYVKYAASRKYLDPVTGEYEPIAEVERLCERCDCRICQSFEREYLALEGELNTMALALHNLAALKSFVTANTSPF